MSDEQLTRLATIDPQIARVVQGMKKENTRKFETERAYHTQFTKKVDDKMSALRTALSKKEFALKQAKEAVLSGEIGPFSLANIAERTGYKELQSVKGAQLLTAAKENLIGNISRVGAKAQNMWIEQRFASQFPEIGKPQETNEMATAILEGEMEMDKNVLTSYERLSKEDENKYGFVKKDIEQRAYKEADIKNEEVLNKTSYVTRDIYEREKGIGWLDENKNRRAVKGTYLTPSMAKVFIYEFKGDKEKALQKAEQLGYQIPTQEEVRKWQ